MKNTCLHALVVAIYRLLTYTNHDVMKLSPNLEGHLERISSTVLYWEKNRGKKNDTSQESSRYCLLGLEHCQLWGARNSNVSTCFVEFPELKSCGKHQKFTLLFRKFLTYSTSMYECIARVRSWCFFLRMTYSQCPFFFGAASGVAFQPYHPAWVGKPTSIPAEKSHASASTFCSCGCSTSGTVFSKQQITKCC